jgi:hypothetical protein
LSCALFVTSCLLTFCIPTVAQPRASILVSGSVSAAPSMGFTGPSFTFSATPEIENRLLMFRFQPYISTGNKMGTGNGFARGTRVEAYGRFNRFLLGGGVSQSRLKTSSYEKSALRPFVGGGLEGYASRTHMRFIGQYFLSGTDRTNHLHGPRFLWDLDMTQRWRFTFEFAAYRFHPSNQPTLPRQTGLTAGFGVSYRLFDSGTTARRY